jgi:hypothetical protein
MRNSHAKNQLDPITVLNLSPEHWELKTQEYNLVTFLSSLFDQMLTVEENTKISKHLTKME